MSLTVVPLLATITINGNALSGVIEADVTLSCDNKASELTVQIDDKSGQWDGVWDLGSPVTVQLNKTGQPMQTIFSGAVDNVRVTHQSKYDKIMTVHATDNSWILMARLINANYITLQTLTNPGFTIDAIVKDLVTNPNRLVTYYNGLNRTPLPFTVNNVQPIPVYVQSKTFINQPVNDCLRELANVGLANFYVDAQNDLHFFNISNVYSSVYTLANPMDQTVIQSLEWEDDGSGSAIQNIILVAGGANVTLDANAQIDSGSYALTYNSYYGQPFTAGNYDLSQISLKIEKLQANLLAPIPPLSGEIREDNSGSPAGGATLTNWNLPADNVATGPNNATWATIPVNANLQPGTKYWLITYQAGQDSQNNYLWHNDGGSTSTNASSSDGKSWNINTSSYNFDFEIWVANQILGFGWNEDSMKAYQPREAVYTDTTIPLQQAATLEAYSYLNILAKKRRQVTITAIPSDNFVNPGEQIYVNYAPDQIVGYYQTLDVSYKISDVSCYEVEYTCMKYIDPPPSS